MNPDDDSNVVVERQSDNDGTTWMDTTISMIIALFIIVQDFIIYIRMNIYKYIYSFFTMVLVTFTSLVFVPMLSLATLLPLG